MSETIDGYDRYRAIVEEILKVCEGRKVDEILWRYLPSGSKGKLYETTIKHYIIPENGLHVYTADGLTYLSDGEIQRLQDGSLNQRKEQFF